MLLYYTLELLQVAGVVVLYASTITVAGVVVLYA